MFLFPSTSSLPLADQCCCFFSAGPPKSFVCMCVVHTMRAYIWFDAADYTVSLYYTSNAVPAITASLPPPKSNSNNSTTNIKQTNKINDDHLNIQRLLRVQRAHLTSMACPLPRHRQRLTAQTHVSPAESTLLPTSTNTYEVAFVRIDSWIQLIWYKYITLR